MWPFRKQRTLKQSLNETKKVHIEGVLFVIRKINPMSYMQGYDVVLQQYEAMKVAPANQLSGEQILKKMRRHWAEIILAGTVSPVIVRKEDGIHATIDEVLDNFELSSGLYSEILAFAYGKKKALQFGLTNNV